MSKILLQIRWQHSLEKIEFDLSQLPKLGDYVTTEDYWAAEKETVTFQAQVTGHHVEKNGAYVFQLRYKAERNKNPKFDGLDTLWGTTTIKLNINNLHATAYWKAEPEHPKWDGAAERCRVVYSGDVSPSDEELFDVLAQPEIPNFIVGKAYNRKAQIHAKYGGGSESGISPSKQVNAIFLFSGTQGKKYGYDDHEGLTKEGHKAFFYVGEGRNGDMVFKRGNLAVLNHAKDGRALHLFRSLGKGKPCIYLGEFVYAGHSIEEGPDEDGLNRKIIVFQLMEVRAIVQLEDHESLAADLHEPPPTSLAEARQRALDATKTMPQVGGATSARILYKRSQAVKDYVLMRAEGKCESCEESAPFYRKNGSPYLEPHHTTRLSDGGLDHPDTVGAICPDCHREIHYGVNGQIKNAVLMAKIVKKVTQVT